MKELFDLFAKLRIYGKMAEIPYKQADEANLVSVPSCNFTVASFFTSLQSQF